jgi:hypothetical protein
LLDTVRKLFKKKKLKEKKDKRTPDKSAKKATNTKCTPDKSAKKASDAKRTPADLNASYKKRTPEHKKAAKRRLQDQRADQDEFDGKDRKEAAGGASSRHGS